MHARYCSPWAGRFLSTDPVGGTPGLPQSWNRYSYVRNNPLNLVDPTGEVDRRSDADKAIFDDPDVMEAVVEMLELTLLEEPLEDRQEAGFAVADEGSGDFSVDGGVVTSNTINQVNIPVRRVKKTGEIVTASEKELAATVHSHTGTGTVRIGIRKIKLRGNQASPADKQLFRVTGKPVYFFNGRTSLLRRAPNPKGKVRTTTILDGAELRAYLTAAGATGGQ